MIIELGKTYTDGKGRQRKVTRWGPGLHEVQYEVIAPQANIDRAMLRFRRKTFSVFADTMRRWAKAEVR